MSEPQREAVAPTLAAANDQDASAASLRIGLFSESFEPVQNGVSTSILTLVDELRRQGHRVYVFAPAHQEQQEVQTNVLRFPSFVSAFNKEYPLAYPFLPRLALTTHFQKLRLDVVHTHTPFILGLTGAKLALRRSVPLISTFHTLYSQYSHYLPFLPDGVTQGLLETYLPWYYNRCAEIICPSEVAANVLRDLGIERPITIVPTGIALPDGHAIGDSAREKVRSELGIPIDAPLMLFAGRLAREKNVDMLLAVYSLVRESVPDVHLAFAGSGPFADELAALANAMPGGENVHFLGPIPHYRMSGVYAAADVFCFPSPSETQGLVVGEARAAGLPCVVVDAGGAPETVREGEDGFCVPEGDTDAFAERVIGMLTNRWKREKMRETARHNALEYTPERMVARVLSVYEAARVQPDAPPSALDRLLHEELDWDSIGQALRENFGLPPRS